MRTDTAQPIRLKDYRPPDWLVETVTLDFSLHTTQTKVRATLALKPNPDAAAAPLVLEGDDLTLTSLKLDGVALPAENYAATPDSLTIPQPPNGPFTLEIETLVDPIANTQLSGLFCTSNTFTIYEESILKLLVSLRISLSNIKIVGVCISFL